MRRAKRYTLFTPCQFFLTTVLHALLAITAYAAPAAAGSFIENKGQWPAQVLFAADIPGGRLYVERARLIYSFYRSQHRHDDATVKHLSTNDSTPNAHAFELRFVNGNPWLQAKGYHLSETTFNYWIGDDPSTWVNSARTFEGVELREVYPGVHLKLYRNGTALKYDFVITPGGRIGDILLEYNGLDDIQLADGNLNLKTALGELTEMKPYAFQVTGGRQNEVKCLFTLRNNRVSFTTPGTWDKTSSLIIDPLIVFSAYSGSTADNWGNTATYDDEGNLYSAGIVSAVGYPVKTGSYQTFFGGVWDIGIMKFDSAGTRMIYATYLGGRSSETPQSLVVNHAGELLIFGSTSSTNFPVTNGSHFNGGNGFTPMDGVPYTNGSDLFVAKLSADGKRLLGATYLGGSSNDGVNFVSGQFDTNAMVQSELCKNYGDQFRGDIITDQDDYVYIASNTTSSNFPASVNTFAGGTHDAVIAKLQPDLSTVLWSRYLGGSSTDAAYSLKLDGHSNIFVAGGTNSTNFYGINGYKKTKGNDIDGWIAQVSPDGQQVINATYLGTATYDQVYFLELNENEEVYVFGQTQGNYPVTSGKFSQSGGGHFIHKLSYDLQSSVFSTVFGSGGYSPNISPTAFLVNDCNKIYIAGWGGALNTTTISYRDPGGVVTIRRNFVGGDTRGLRVSNDAYQSNTSGNDFYLMVLDEDASAFLYGTFLGGSRSVTHVDGGTSRFDKRGIVYHAVCAGCGGHSDFPAVNSPSGHNRNGATFSGAGCNNAAFKFDLATLRAVVQSNSVSFSTPGLDTLCFPSAIVFQNLSSGAKYYVWDLGDGTTVTKNDTAHITHTYQHPGVYLVTLTAFNNETCEGQDLASLAISVFDPEIEVSDDGTICEGSNYQLYASGGKSYSWISDDGEFGSSLPNPLVTPNDTTIYYVTVADEVGCDVKDTVLVNVVPKPSYVLMINKNYDCWNRPEVRFAYTADDDYNYLWHLGDGNTSTSKDFVHHYEKDGTYTVVFHASNNYCSYQENSSIPVITVRIPNVITPDHDGLNDVLQVEAFDAINVQIYNRWGDLVFREENYKNDWYAKGLGSGTYFYKIDVENETTCKGWIQVIK